MLKYAYFFFIFIMGWLLPVDSSTFTKEGSPVKAELLQEERTIQAGRPFWIALRLQLEDGWHVYWKNPGDVGVPLSVEWLLPEGFQAGPLQWPTPEKFLIADMAGFGYQNEVILLIQMTPPQHLHSETKLEVRAQVKWLACSPLACQPGSSSTVLPLMISHDSPLVNKEFAEVFKQARYKIPQKMPHVVKIIRKQEIFQIEVPREAIHFPSNSISAYFFPEQNNILDHSIEPVIAFNSENSNLCCIHLKGNDGDRIDHKYLRGILTLYEQKGASRKLSKLLIFNAQLKKEEM